MNSAVAYNNVPSGACVKRPISVVTPDGGLLYTGMRCINYIADASADSEEAPEIRTMSTRIYITALDVSPMWGKQTKFTQTKNQQFAIVGEDATVQVWDCMLGEAISGHKAHQHHHGAREVGAYPYNGHKMVALSYMANGNILSIDANDLVLYCVTTNAYSRRPSFIPSRNHQITALRCAPFNDHMFAVGTVAGVVLICDLLKMSITYKLKANKSKIVDLAWRVISPLPKVEAQKDYRGLTSKAEQWRSSHEAIPAKSSQTREVVVDPNDDIFDIYNFDHLKDEFGVSTDSRHRMNSKSSDEYADFVGVEKTISITNLATELTTGSQVVNYAEACESMKADLIAHQSVANENVDADLEVTLADCQQAHTATAEPHSNSDFSKSASTEGSLELIQYSCSSDDAVIVDGDAPKPKREVLHHIYHQAEVHAAENAAEITELSADTFDPNAAELPKIPFDKSDENKITAQAQYFEDIAPQESVILGSVAEDEKIVLWDPFTGANRGTNHIKTNSSKNNLSTKINWLSDNVIVSTSKSTMSFWSLEGNTKFGSFKLVRHKSYACPVNNILTFATIPKMKYIWMCLDDQKVVLLNPSTGKMVATFGCLCLGIRAIAECPVDPHKIALGCSNKRVSILDLSNLQARLLPIKGIYVNTPVYTLAWSPNCNQLAYGGFDGNVGIIDLAYKKVVATFRPAFKKEVYSLMWHNTDIYFVANRQVGVYNATQAFKPAKVLKSIKYGTYLSIRGSFIFAGTNDGFLNLYERKEGTDLEYTSVRQAPLTSRYITDIAWNPSISNQFAVVGHDRHAFVMEFLEESRNWKLLEHFKVDDLNGSITSLKWSMSQAHMFLTFHIEGTVCVWNMKQPTAVPLVLTYNCPMWCGMFLPVDENIIICSGKTLTLEFVNIKEKSLDTNKNFTMKGDPYQNVKWGTESNHQPYKTLTKIEKRRQRERKHSELEAKSRCELHPTCTAIAELSNTKEQPIDLYNKIAENVCVYTKNARGPEIPIEEMEALSIKTSKTQSTVQNEDIVEPAPTFLSFNRTCLHLAQKELNKDALEKLGIVLTEDAEDIKKSVLLAKLFGTKMDAKELLEKELQNLKVSNSKGLAMTWVAMTSFQLRDELEMHLENGTLNEWHLSLAPSVSYNFWVKCCQGFAQQLKANGFIFHAATYLVAIHLPQDSVQLLLEHGYFKEALLLARVYLPATDPIIRVIIEKWVDYLGDKGNFGAAALICVLDNNMLRGWTFLRKYRNCTQEIGSLIEKIRSNAQLENIVDFEEKIDDVDALAKTVGKGEAA